MAIEDFQSRLNALIGGLPDSGFDAVSDTILGELKKFEDEADTVGMKAGKKLVANLAEALRTRKSGGNTDESIQVRLIALDFYLKNLQAGTTEEL
jgi:rRNA-processing protein FCF1